MVRWFMLVALAGCASEIAARNPQLDPTSTQAEEAPARAAPELPHNDPTLSVVESPQPAPTPTPSVEPHHHHESAPPESHHHGSAPAESHQHKPPLPEKAKPEHEHGKIYTCPMHPEVRSDKPGKCPKCGMTLVEKASP